MLSPNTSHEELNFNLKIKIQYKTNRIKIRCKKQLYPSIIMVNYCNACSRWCKQLYRLYFDLIDSAAFKMSSFGANTPGCGSSNWYTTPCSPGPTTYSPPSNLPSPDMFALAVLPYLQEVKILDITLGFTRVVKGIHLNLGP